MAGYGKIANLTRVIHQVGHKISSKEDGRQIILLDNKLLLHDGLDDGLSERLGILLLYEGFDIGAIDLLGGWVVLLVFVKDHGI